MASLKCPLSNPPKCPKGPQSHHKQGAKPVTREAGRHRGSSGTMDPKAHLEAHSGRSYKAQATVLTAPWCRRKCCTRRLQLSPGQSEARHTIRHPLVAGQRYQQPGHFCHRPSTKQYRQFSTLWEQKPGQVFSQISDRPASGAPCVRAHQAVLWWHLPPLRLYLRTGFKKHIRPDTRLLQQSGGS